MHATTCYTNISNCDASLTKRFSDIVTVFYDRVAFLSNVLLVDDLPTLFGALDAVFKAAGKVNQSSQK